MIKLWKLQDAPRQIKELAPESSESIWVFEIPTALMPEIDQLFDGGADRIKALSKHVLGEASVVLFVRNEAAAGNSAKPHSSFWAADA